MWACEYVCVLVTSSFSHVFRESQELLVCKALWDQKANEAKEWVHKHKPTQSATLPEHTVQFSPLIYLHRDLLDIQEREGSKESW